jgi:hypothetical protein
MKRHQSREQVLTAVALVAAFAAVLTALIRWFLREPPLDVSAENYVQAVYRGDPGPIINAAPQYELDKMGLSRSRAAVLVKDFILPKFKGARVVKFERPYIQSSGMSGVALVTIQTDSGEEFSSGAILERSDSGPIRLLKHLLEDAWIVEYCKEVKPKSLDSLAPKAVLWGLEKDQGVLRSYGIKGFAQESESAPARTIEEALERANSLVRSRTKPEIVMPKNPS